MTSPRGPRITRPDLEWLQRRAASEARNTEGTKEGQHWKHWHDWAWSELVRRVRNEEPEQAAKSGEET